jgi:FixJ family two-component response regulator
MTWETEVTNEPLICIVDDDDSARGGMMDLVQSMGFFVSGFPCAEEFLESRDLRHASCLITDMRMPGMSGLQLYDRLRDSGDVIPTILMTAFPNDRDRTQAQRIGVICYLAKPVKDDELFECVHSAFEAARTGSGRVNDE